MEKEYLKEYLGAYDGWLTYKNKGEDFERHRINNEKCIKIEQKEEYGNVYFETENGEKFINLTKI